MKILKNETFLILACICSFNVFSQLNYQFILRPSFSNLSTPKNYIFNDDYTPIFTFDYGVLIDKTLSENTSFSTGLIFSQYGKVSEGGGGALIQNIDKVNFTYFKDRVGFFTLPFIFNCNFKKMLFSTGLENNLYFTHSTVEEDVNSKKTVWKNREYNKFENLKESYFPSINIAIGMKVKIYSNFSLHIQPYFNYLLGGNTGAHYYKYGLSLKYVIQSKKE